MCDTRTISGALAIRLSSRKVNILSEQLESLKSYIPLEFNRKPRTLHELPRWKATEFRTFLLYLGPLVLKNIVDTAVYENYLLFHTAISILISAKFISKFSCAFPQELLNIFVKHCEQLYGQEFLIYNVHILCHLADDVQIYRLLDLFSCFPFENYLGQIKNLIKSPNYPLQQIGRRLHEMNAALENNLPIIEKQFIHAVEDNLTPLPEKFRSVFCKQFKKFKHGDFTITTHSYSSVNSYCLMKNNMLIQIQNVISLQEIFVVGKYFTSYDSLYKYPLDSKELNIYVVKNLTHESDIWPFHDILAKCIVFPFDNCWHIQKTFIGIIRSYPLYYLLLETLTSVNLLNITASKEDAFTYLNTPDPSPKRIEESINLPTTTSLLAEHPTNDTHSELSLIMVLIAIKYTGCPTYKCEFLKTEVTYLGHVISKDGVKPDPEKLEAVQRFPRPKTPKNIKQFLGLAGYYRRFIPNFSKFAKPLTNLLKNDTRFE
ncbi:uncharacterized protein [Polyergus mexicanus]|uniref:uncharacterized protein n=1 Tax=Polyergus mexicanus TaxID=615972 RepID=UPI0038B60527